MATVGVAIVGGGIAGLAAAYELQRRGVSVQVLEAAARVGGVISSDRFDGWVVDGGPDSMLVQKPAAVALCRDLGLGDRLIHTLPPRTAYVMRAGQLHPLVEGSFLGFPLTAAGLIRSPIFSAAGKMRMALEPFMPRRSGDEDESIGAFVRRRFGKEAVDYLAEPLLAGIHAGDVERLSIRALFPRLVDAEHHAGSVLRAFRALRSRPSSNGAFVSLPGGTGELIDTLATALDGTICLDVRVNALHRIGMLRIETSRGPIDARAVILAVPAYVAGSLLRGFDTTLAAFCDAVPYASTATVALGFRREHVAHPLAGTGFVVPRVERRGLLAATWISSKWPGRAPEGHVLLRGFLGGGRDPHRLDDSDQMLIDTTRHELGALLGISAEPLFVRVYRFTKQSPQYEVGHLERVAQIEQRLAAIPGVFVTGSGFRAIGIPDCVADARATAAIAAGYVSSASH
ncbi:MAG TPA: protoporphyrinogen oxidase [Vicinamibacterales bacterium]|jgi:protoporphyrinogen/coproporphyrinogen III oxidase|nr:protoporphyrinogen oxidase [Vicinamibacterales bacterium]